MVNNVHDILILLFDNLGFHLTDKDLHFWVIGIIGILFFFVTDVIFKALAKWSISVLSFVYTFTVFIVLVFSLEIEQKITNRGHMEFNDIIAGLWGFFAIFGVYLGIRLVAYLIMRITNKNRRRTKRNR
ncbi:hypothetical protein [Tepidibacillus marianensis]|uniref:hypothetical protein n=1 Tax=Tepidibacillus marianensis TaxID=3131995 RepID=UPI0030D2853C